MYLVQSVVWHIFVYLCTFLIHTKWNFIGRRWSCWETKVEHWDVPRASHTPNRTPLQSSSSWSDRRSSKSLARSLTLSPSPGLRVHGRSRSSLLCDTASPDCTTQQPRESEEHPQCTYRTSRRGARPCIGSSWEVPVSPWNNETSNHHMHHHGLN